MGLFVLIPIIFAIVFIVVFISAITIMIKGISQSHIIDDLGKDLKSAGKDISEGINNLTSTPVEKCPNCGANISDTHQKKCQYCGGVLPRKSRFFHKNDQK